MRLVTSLQFLSIAIFAWGCGYSTPPSGGTLSVTVLAPYVGQGAGTALVHGQSAVVFDAGPFDQNGLVVALRNEHVDTIDAIYLTHPDLDHWGGLDSLLAHFPVRTLIHGPVDSAREASTFHWACRQTLSGCDTTWRDQTNHHPNGVHIEVLWPDSGASFPETNDGSLVLRASIASHGILLVSGDLDTLGEQKVSPQVNPVEVVDLGHHGSRSSASLSYLGKASAKWAVVQAGIPNSYGHPTDDALARARAVGAHVLQPTPTNPVKLKLEFVVPGE